MKTIKLFLNNISIGLLIIFSSCTEEDRFFPSIESIPCEQTNVIIDPNIISDFQCQANVILDGVETVLNPDESGANTSRFVGQYNDPSGPWDALIIDYGSSIDLSTFNTFKIKVKTSVAGTLKAKLEGGSSPGKEVDANITNTSGWVEYSFDFSDQFNQDHTKLVLFFNAGVENDGSDIYYIDDLKWVTTPDPCAGVAENLNVVNDFDCQKNQEVPEVELIANPLKSDINNSKFVGKYIDEMGAWDAVIIDYGEPIDLSSHNVFKIKVLAPVEGILKAKLEGGTSAGIEKDASITKTGEWVEYSYDFSDQAIENHNKIVIFFNAGVETDGTQVYYIDDLKFAELSDACNGVTPDRSVINDFNCQQNTTIPGFIPNSIVENPMVVDANPSDLVLEVIDNGTEAFDALVFESSQSFDLSTKNFFKIKILAERAVPLLVKLEGGTSPAKEVFIDIDVVGVWAEYTVDFTDQASADHKKLVLFFNGGQSDGTPTDKYYIDDLRFAAFDPCDSVAANMDIVSDFECQKNYEITCCVTTEIVDNPAASGINTSSKVLKVTDNGLEAFDALVFDRGGVIGLSTKNKLKIKILSSRAVPLLVKLEGGTSTPKEIFIDITVVDQWTEYTIDFSDQASANHQKLVFFFNGGQSSGTATDIYYIDDIRWE
jgi:molybdopterin-binding protein